MESRTKLGTKLGKKSNLTRGDFSWRKVDEIKPIELDLIEVKDKENKTQYAWLYHGNWYFGKKKIKDDILEWRKIPKEDNQW